MQQMYSYWAQPRKENYATEVIAQVGESEDEAVLGAGSIRIVWGFPKIRGTVLGVPIIRTIVLWSLYWGPLILGNYLYSPTLS